MKIDYLQISNVLSFDYHADIGNAQKIAFDNGLNIIIGENGSGKSTALEVINFLFKRVLYRQYSVNQDLFGRRTTLTAEERKQIIQPANHSNIKEFRIEPNWDHEDKPQRIRVALKLDDIDDKNIENLRANFSKLSRTTTGYSTHSVTDDGEYRKSYVIDVIPNWNANSFEVQIQGTTSDFGFVYLSEYNFFKECISLHNFLEPSDPIDPLYESFTLISSYRNYHAFEPSVSLRDAHPAQQIQKIRRQEFLRSLNASDNSEPPIFALVRLRVAEKHFSLISGRLSEEDCEAQANDLDFMKSINNRLRSVNLSCKIQLLDLRTWQYRFEFFDLRRNKVISDINSLSAGQKAILHLVFEAYGRGDLKGGVVIIDEPEIHLHYQFQHEYLQVIDDLNREQDCQYILVTHSEALINSKTINNVRRFSLNSNGHTVIHAPKLNADQKSLIKILDNTRSTYAFFAKKVLLVEGDTDRYFFRAVILERHRSLDQEIAVLHIGGKGEFKKWAELFASFGLVIFAIADFDYLVDLHFPNERGVSLKTDQLISGFKARNPDWQTKLESEYTNNTFVLKEGNLESYLGVKKDLGNTIEFCQTKLITFLANDSSSKSKEVRWILDTVTS
ncbi:MAG: AAA family ATPase [Beijerinckiaceae bacterium]